MAAGLNALAMVGADCAVTVRLAVLLAGPAVVVCTVVTPEAILGWLPAMVLVTLNMIVQLPLAGIVMPLKLSAVAPEVREPGAVPAHVPVTFPAAAVMFTSVSVKVAPVRAVPLLLDSVKVKA